MGKLNQMVCTLAEVRDDLISLEFEESDIPAVREAILNRFGDFKQTKHVLTSEISFGGATFTFYNEWGDPCLISRKAEDREILKLLHADILASQAAKSNA